MLDSFACTFKNNYTSWPPSVEPQFAIDEWKYSGYRRLYLCDRFFEQKMAENEDKNTHRLENNGYYSSIRLVSVNQILASTK